MLETSIPTWVLAMVEVVDTQGLLLVVAVHPADLQDRDGARLVLARLKHRFPPLRRLWTDAVYAVPNWGPGCRRPRAGSRPSSGTDSRARVFRSCTGFGSSSAAPAEYDRDYPCNTPLKVVQSPA